MRQKDFGGASECHQYRCADDGRVDDCHDAPWGLTHVFEPGADSCNQCRYGFAAVGVRGRTLRNSARASDGTAAPVALATAHSPHRTAGGRLGRPDRAVPLSGGCALGEQTLRSATRRCVGDLSVCSAESALADAQSIQSLVRRGTPGRHGVGHAVRHQRQPEDVRHAAMRSRSG